MPPRPPAALTRRAALGLLGGGLLALAGCDLEPIGSPSVDVPGIGTPDPDEALVDAVLDAVRTQAQQVQTVQERFAGLRASLGPLQEMHRAHLAALGVDEAVPPGALAGRSRRRRAAAQVRTSEAAHQQVLVTAALAARSGALARLLASMAASVGQHLGVLTTGDPGGGADESADDTTVAAWQQVLGAEQAAVYVWGVLGARTSQAAMPALLDAVRAAYVEHRDRRDDLIGLIAATGTAPTPAATAYQLPEDLETAAGVTAAAVLIEQRSAEAYAALVAATAGAARRQAIGWLELSAIRVLAFRGTPEMFPGAGEYADR